MARCAGTTVRVPTLVQSQPPHGKRHEVGQPQGLENSPTLSGHADGGPDIPDALK